MDVYLPGSGDVQIHDLNPTQFPPVGLFWTVPLPANGVAVDLTTGTATKTAVRVPIYDYGTGANVIFTGNNPPPAAGWVSFKVVRTGGSMSETVISKDPTKGHFLVLRC